MIASSIVILTLLGCGNDLQTCDVVAENQVAWTDLDACKAAIPAELEAVIDAPYPVLSARCDLISEPQAITAPKVPASEGIDDDAGSILATVTAWTNASVAPVSSYAIDGWTVLKKSAAGGFETVGVVWDVFTFDWD